MSCYIVQPALQTDLRQAFCCASCLTVSRFVIPCLVSTVFCFVLFFSLKISFICLFWNREGLMYPSWLGIVCVPFWHVLPYPVYVQLAIEPRALGTLGNHSTNWATSPVVFIEIGPHIARTGFEITVFDSPWTNGKPLWVLGLEVCATNIRSWWFSSFWYYYFNISG